MSKQEIDEMPLYTAYLCMGAISKDKIGLRMSQHDEGEYRIAIARRREEQRNAGRKSDILP